MKVNRALLLPVAMVLEVLLLAACWTFAAVAPKLATVIKDWAMRSLPSMDWYRQG